MESAGDALVAFDATSPVASHEAPVEAAPSVTGAAPSSADPEQRPSSDCGIAGTGKMIEAGWLVVARHAWLTTVLRPVVQLAGAPPGKRIKTMSISPGGPVVDQASAATVAS